MDNKKSILFDCHCHVHFPTYDKDRKEVIERTQKAGVKIIVVGTQISTSESAVRFANEYPSDAWATVGYHPSHIVGRPDIGGTSNGWHHDPNEQFEAAPEKFDALRLHELARDPKVVAIGECGLDYYRLATSDWRLATSIKEKQKEIFLKQIDIAKKLDKALMIHCRPSKGTDDAYNDLLVIIHNSKFMITKVLHFYVGSLEITKKLVDAGFYFTFGGVVTFARDYDEQIKYIPLDRILLETDSPYVAPKSQRGKRNEPAFILETAQKIAQIKQISYGELASAVLKNSLTVFKISLDS